MMPLVAQMMPEMEWIPVMVVVTVGGLLTGIVALLLRIFGSGALSGSKLGKTAIGIGVGSAVLFLTVNWTRLNPIAYLILATPAIPGAIALTIRPRREVRFVLRIISGLVGLAVIAGIAWYWIDSSVPPGVHAEEPTESGWMPVTVIHNPFDLPPAIDLEQQLFFQSFNSPVKSVADVSVNCPSLDQFSGPKRQLLLRHLATSAKWFVGRDIVNGQEKVVARRRYIEGGMWLNQLNGFIDDNEKQIRIVLGLDGQAYANVFQNATFARTDQGNIRLNVVSASSGSSLHDSYLVVSSLGAVLELFEESNRSDCPFTSVALSQLNQEFSAVLSSELATRTGFDPGLMPKESIRRGGPDMHLVNFNEENGTYQVLAYVNPGESGYVYLKVFDGRGNRSLSDDDYSKRNTLEYTGWSSDAQEQFFYNTEFDFGQPLIANTFAVRIELWFVPATGAPERKVLEKYFNVK